MSDEKKYYCYCDSNCKYETMTREQILAAIAQAVETGSVGNCDTGFITKLKEQNGGNGVTLWVGTQAQYNAIATKAQNCLYIITDDTTCDDALNACAKEAAAAATNAGAANAAAADALTKATAALQYCSVDCTNDVSFSWLSGSGGYNFTVLEANALRFEHNPRTGIVHFVFSMKYAGKAEKGERIRFITGNYYAPERTSGVLAYPICANRNNFSAEYSNFDGRLCINIYAEEEINTQGATETVYFSGWYFCRQAG
jgi:hypothetical protein